MPTLTSLLTNQRSVCIAFFSTLIRRDNPSTDPVVSNRDSGKPVDVWMSSADFVDLRAGDWEVSHE